MIFLACVETWDISYNRVINNNILKDFWFVFRGFFFCGRLGVYFGMVKYLSFHNSSSSSFAFLRYYLTFY